MLRGFSSGSIPVKIMFSFFLRLSLGLLADALRDRLDPHWEYRRAQDRIKCNIAASMYQSEIMLRDFFWQIEEMADRYYSFALEMREETDE